MTAEPPSMDEIVGTWECYDVSPEFLRTAGLNSKDFSSKLIFKHRHPTGKESESVSALPK